MPTFANPYLNDPGNVNGRILRYTPQASETVDSPDVTPDPEKDQRGLFGQFFTNDDGSYNFSNIGAAFKGVESLGKLWLGYQAYRDAKERLAFAREAYNTNLADQRQTYNTALEDRIRARHFTEGRPQGDTERYIRENRLA